MGFDSVIGPYVSGTRCFYLFLKPVINDMIYRKEVTDG